MALLRLSGSPAPRPRSTCARTPAAGQGRGRPQLSLGRPACVFPVFRGWGRETGLGHAQWGGGGVEGRGRISGRASLCTLVSKVRPGAALRWAVFTNDFWGKAMAENNSHKSDRPLCVLTFK